MTAHITVIGGTKGGSGKSTVSVNLAILFARAGRDVLLIDADDQQTSKIFTDLRNETKEGGAGYTCIALNGAAVRTETRRLADKYQEIIIDCGGRDTASQRAALTVGNTFLVPFQPRSFDVWTIENVSGLVEEIRAVNPDLDALAFINRADARGTDNEDAANFLGESPALTFINTPFGSRKAYANAAAAGLSVVEMKPADKKAVEEVLTLYKRLISARQSQTEAA